MDRLLVIPDRLSVKGLVNLYRYMQANPTQRWVNQSNEWAGHDNSNREWFEWFQDCLTDKIFSKGPQPGKGNRSLRRLGMSVTHKCKHDPGSVTNFWKRTMHCASCELRGAA